MFIILLMLIQVVQILLALVRKKFWKCYLTFSAYIDKLISQGLVLFVKFIFIENILSFNIFLMWIFLALTYFQCEYF